MSSVNNIVPPSPPRPAPSLPSLLDANQYDRTAQWLQAAQQKAQEEGDTARVTLMTAAQQLCVICRQLQDEANYHQHTYQNAVTHKKELEQQLKQLLNLLQQSPETAGTPPTIISEAQINLTALEIPETKGDASLWRRLQGFVKRGLSRELPLSENLIDQYETRNIIETVSESASLSVVEKKEHEVEEIEVVTETAVPHLAIYCLGPFRVYQNDHLLSDWNGLKGQRILKYLVAHHSKPIAKDVLMDVFWPDADPEAARRNLHQAVYSLRQTLKEQEPDFQHILYENDCYLFNPELNIWLDFQEFEQHVQNGRRLETAGKQSAAMAEFGIAEALFQGNFMSEDLYEEWPQPERERLQNLYLDVADSLSNFYLERREFAIAIALCQKILRQDNCVEQAYFRIMSCYQAQGQRHLAIRYFLSCKETLEEELGLMPAAETVELYRELIA